MSAQADRIIAEAETRAAAHAKATNSQSREQLLAYQVGLLHEAVRALCEQIEKQPKEST